MATTIQQVMSELDPYYKDSRNLLNQQLETLPRQGDAEIAGLEAKLGVANNNILESARSRGLGFSGIPVAEQTKYAATEFAPAVAKVKAGQETSRLGILEALNGLGRDQRTLAENIYDKSEARRLQEAQLAEQSRQFDEAQRTARSSGGSGVDLSPYLGAPGGGASKTQATATYGFKNGKNGAGGFWFKDASGRNITANAYAAATGVPILHLINKMAQQGDNGAKSILKGPGIDTKSLTWQRYFA